MRPYAESRRSAGTSSFSAAAALPAPLRVARRSLQRVQAFAEAHRRDPEVVDRAAVRRLQDLLSILEWIEIEVFGDLVDLALEAVARLCRAVPALRTARRLVRIDADAVELIRRDAVRDRQKRAGVVRGRDPVRRVRAAVQPALVVH